MFRSKEPVVGDGQGAEGKASEEQGGEGKGKFVPSVQLNLEMSSGAHSREAAGDYPPFRCPRTAGRSSLSGDTWSAQRNQHTLRIQRIHGQVDRLAAIT